MKMLSLTDLPEEGVSHDPGLRKRMMIRDDEVPHLKKFGQIRMRPGQVAHAHAHSSEYEIFLVESGEGVTEITTGKYPMSTGTCVVFEPTEVHEITSTGADDLVLTYFGIAVPA